MNCPFCNSKLSETSGKAGYESFMPLDEEYIVYCCANQSNHEFFYRTANNSQYELFGLISVPYAIGCFKGICYFSIDNKEMIIEKVEACQALEVMNKYIRLKAFI